MFSPVFQERLLERECRLLVISGKLICRVAMAVPHDISSLFSGHSILKSSWNPVMSLPLSFLQDL